MAKVGLIYTYDSVSVNYYYCGEVRGNHVVEIIDGNCGVHLDKCWLPNWEPKSTNRYWIFENTDGFKYVQNGLIRPITLKLGKIWN